MVARAKKKGVKVSLRTLFAYVIKFYGFSFDEVWYMPLTRFTILANAISEINRIEYGDGDTDEKKPLSGKTGFRAVQTILPKGKGHNR